MSGVVLWLAQSEHDVPESDGWLAPWEADRVAAMRFTKRRYESRMARWATKRAIALALDLGADADLSAVEIRNAPDGAPEVDITGSGPLSISMTDRAGWAVGFVRPGPGAIGCDLELVERRSDAFIADYLTPAEREIVRSNPEPDMTANLIWSAKESALKVLRTGLRRDTRSVEVAVDLRPVPSEMGWRPLTVTSSEGGLFPGWWQRFGEFILTFASERAAPSPRSLVEPSPLTTAVPAHSWIGRPLFEG